MGSCRAAGCSGAGMGNVWVAWATSTACAAGWGDVWVAMSAWKGCNKAIKVEKARKACAALFNKPEASSAPRYALTPCDELPGLAPVQQRLQATLHGVRRSSDGLNYLQR